MNKEEWNLFIERATEDPQLLRRLAEAVERMAEAIAERDNEFRMYQGCGDVGAAGLDDNKWKIISEMMM